MKYFVIFAMCCLALTAAAAAPQHVRSNIGAKTMVVGPSVYTDNFGGSHVSPGYIKQFGEEHRTSDDS